MNSKENAKELVERFYNKDFENIWNPKTALYEAKQCALICVEEKIKTLELLEPSIGGRQSGKSRLSKEWINLQEVKQEIEKL